MSFQFHITPLFYQVIDNVQGKKGAKELCGVGEEEKEAIKATNQDGGDKEEEMDENMDDDGVNMQGLDDDEAEKQRNQKLDEMDYDEDDEGKDRVYTGLTKPQIALDLKTAL